MITVTVTNFSVSSVTYFRAMPELYNNILIHVLSCRLLLGRPTPVCVLGLLSLAILTSLVWSNLDVSSFHNAILWPIYLYLLRRSFLLSSHMKSHCFSLSLICVVVWVFLLFVFSFRLDLHCTRKLMFYGAIVCPSCCFLYAEFVLPYKTICNPHYSTNRY